MLFDFLIRRAQFLTFAAIGLINTIIHGAALVLAVEYAELESTTANLFAFLIANIFSYILNSKYTFKSAPSIFQYLRFLSASLIAMAITLLISIAAEHLRIHYLIGFSLIVLCVPPISFLIMKIWAFSHTVKSR